MSRIRLRKAADRGITETEWLESYHTFSFNRYVDRDWTRFHVLRVINEDYVAPGQGFPMHSHSDMEIVTYVINGAVHHRDSSGTDGVIRAGEVQRMSAGTGIRHSEMNASDTESLHLLQIWIVPEEGGIEPSYEKTRVPDRNETGLDLLGSPDSSSEGVYLHQDCFLYRGFVGSGEKLKHEFEDGRAAWIQIIRGEGTLTDGTVLESGDGAGMDRVPDFQMTADASPLEFLLFDLPRVDSS